MNGKLAKIQSQASRARRNPGLKGLSDLLKKQKAVRLTFKGRFKGRPAKHYKELLVKEINLEAWEKERFNWKVELMELSVRIAKKKHGNPRPTQNDRIYRPSAPTRKRKNRSRELRSMAS